MKQLSKIWLRVFISFLGGAFNTEIISIITKGSNRLSQDQSSAIGFASTVIIYAVLTFFVKQYKKNI